MTGNETLLYSDLDMKVRLASVFLLLVLVGGAFAGVPMSFSESQCSMGGMMNMECCRAMLLQQSRAKFTHAEELLCALNCAQNGTTLPASFTRVAQPTLVIHAPPQLFAQPLPLSLSLSITAIQAHSPPGSPPTYLRNLTLLI